MLRAIEDRNRIEECYDLFRSFLVKLRGEKMSVRLSYRASGMSVEVTWVSDFEFWYELGGSGSNSFGASRPSLTGSNAIACEMNFTSGRVDRRFGGVFAEGLDGTRYVLHRGRVGGGRKNVGKRGLVHSFIGRVVEFIDGENISIGFPVVTLGGRNFPSQLSFFVHERFKENIVVDKRYADVVVPRRFFLPPYLGRWNRKSRDPVDRSFEHGLVIGTLANILIDRGVRVETDMRNDLTTLNRAGSVRTVYEVDVVRSLESVYASIGRLISASKRSKGRIKRVLVLPEARVMRDVESASIEGEARNLGIKILHYRILNGGVIFSEDRNILA